MKLLPLFFAVIFCSPALSGQDKFISDRMIGQSGSPQDENSSNFFSKSLFISDYQIIEMPYRHRFGISTFNDNWSGGFTEIHDDLRSYGVEASYVFPEKGHKNFKATGRFSGFTFRTGDPAFQQRTDELFLKIEKPIYFFKNGSGNIRAHIGSYIIGKLTSEKIQNLWHETFGVRLLNLEYKIRNTAFAEIGFSGHKNIYSEKITERLNFASRIELSENLAFKYLNRFEIGLPMTLTSVNGDYFTLKIAGIFNTFFTEDFLLKQVLEAENGFKIGIEGGFGKMLFCYNVFPGNQFSSGGVGLRFPFFSPEEKQFKKTDFAFEIGLLTDGNGYFSKFLFPQKKFLSQRFSITLHHGYGTYLKKRLLDYPNQNGHYRQVGIGGDFQFFKEKTGWQFNPFISAATGVKTFSTYSGDFEVGKLADNAFFAQADLGLKINLPIQFLENHCRYGMTFFYRTIFQPLSEKGLVYERLRNFEKNPGMIGGGVFIGMNF